MSILISNILVKSANDIFHWTFVFRNSVRSATKNLQCDNYYRNDASGNVYLNHLHECFVKSYLFPWQF